jgi:hypothetical protein
MASEFARPKTCSRASMFRRLKNGVMRFKTNILAMVFAAASALTASCVSTQSQSCDLTPAETQLLRSNIYAFLPKELPEVDVRCEEISESTQYLRGHGCAIYGQPRSGLGCPTTLDGDYFIVFNRATLKAKGLVPVPH